ncbi:hypothetical protein [Pseudodesulfovibrio sp.]|uniref:hypothetical protein n=1 Tax=Pseudodesulfovibrio sp. TaxID=2035812 RepID=UPI0026091465|nr:hypothetical protein [Pseudodesulfovibrio sp.]MDD3312969.1 hypothetical protein [Pseudodesulfovibrio sp.]
MNSQETLALAATLLAPAFFSLLGMGAFGSPVVAVLGELAAKSKKRIFYDKFGQQAGAMGRLLLVLLILVWGASCAVVYFRFPQLAERLIAPGAVFIEAAVACAVFLLAGLIHFSTWKAMRQAKGAHIALGLLAAVASVTALALAVPAKLMLNRPDGAADSLFGHPMALPLAVMYALLSVACAAGLAAAYLVLRRNRDDFGRDYYNFSLPLAARWAVIPMLGFLVCQGWLFAVLPETFRTMTLGTPLCWVWLGVAVLGLVCAALWLVVARSKTPLRLKGLCFLALALLWIMHTLSVTLFVNFMSML